MSKLSAILIVLPFFLIRNCFGQKPSFPRTEKEIMTIHHDAWDTLLRQYVDENGNVDYQGFASKSQQLGHYLDYLTTNPISVAADKEEQLAYYINLYNAGTIQLILEHYPIESIKDISRPWDKNRFKIGEDQYSLGEIEHGILRKMEEPRIHFAINCASYSCPRLLNEAFTAAKMEEQLHKATIGFINDPSKNEISKNHVAISKIFKWYAGDFTHENGLIGYLNQYSEIKVPLHSDIDHLTYDWSLNEKK